MGNGTSQSIVLGSPAHFPRNNSYFDNRGVPKYAHPQNRVLPKPIAGQRLRNTDNGSILQTAGTLRGQRGHNSKEEESTDPEVMGILKRRSEMIENYHQLNLRNHRLFHSDPNIARRPPSSDGYDVELPEVYTNRRSCGGGVAVRASKLKYKKKTRAPDPPPPPSGNSLPRQLEGRSQSSPADGSKKSLACKCIMKSRAPQPPPIVIHPPPPPPLPLTTRTVIGSSKSQTDSSSKSPSSVTRAVASKDNRMSYEKNVHPLEKWRNCRSTGDVRLDEQEESSASRTTVFDSRTFTEIITKPSYLPHRPDPFQKEIQAVTKKIAESRQSASQTPKKDKPPPTQITPNSKLKEASSPPKFYFSDVGIFKTNNQRIDSNSVDENELSDKISKGDPLSSKQETPALQRFSPARRRYKSPSRSSTPNHQQERKEWDRLATTSLQSQSSLEPQIDLRLRPVLPRKLQEVPKFSASEAWQALGSGGSHCSTSEDNHRVSQEDISDFNRFQQYENRFKNRSFSDSHWTPRQDLLDDSDVSSDGSEDAVVPKIRPELHDLSPRFSLPTVMFSKMRPIGSDINSLQTTNSTKYAPKKRASKQSSHELTSLAPTFKRFLSKRNKYMSEEDLVQPSDSNWTFGQYGLQKRGKQYSSDLMLSDKKKFELMAKNHLSDFLGDILLSKADHMRKQMESSSHSNFSFYSTEGQIMFKPEKGGFVTDEECATKGKVYDIRKKFDGDHLRTPNHAVKNVKKKFNQNGIEMGRRRDLELAKMLEDEVRKRRNKEKITIRQQLQRLKHLESDEEENDDEAYFTEPKSREDSQSPFFASDLMNHPIPSELGVRPFRVQHIPPPLSHWQSSPALLEDSVRKMAPSHKGRLSMSSVMSSPEPDVWTQSRAVDSWLVKQKRNLDILPKALDHPGSTDHANDGDVSSSPTPAAPKKERRKTNIYQQLMDIVRKEERHMKKKQMGEAKSMDSCYSPRESSTCSSSTSSYSYSDSSSGQNQGIIPANKEFHAPPAPTSSFQVAFAQPYSPHKSYRPVPFDIVHRMPGLQEERNHLQAKVS